MQREQYAAAVADLPIFYQPWWLDAVCGPEAWSAAAAYDGGGQLQGLLPFYLYRRAGLKFLAPPPLSPNVGPWLFYPDEGLKPASRHDFEWRVMTELARQLPQFDFAQVKCPYRLQNAMPWQRMGWRQSARYSYVVPAEKSADQAWADMSGRTRTAIRKAEREGLGILHSESIEALYRLSDLSFSHRGARLPFSLAWLQKLDEAVAARAARRLYLARDEDGHIHAAVYTVFDRYATYNLLQGSDPARRQSGAAAALLWRAIADSLQAGRRFDFEGSRIPGVEEFFRGFGGELWAYGQLEKTRGWLARTIAIWREMRQP